MRALLVASLFAFAATAVSVAPVSVAEAARPTTIDTTRSDQVVFQYRFRRGQRDRYELETREQVEMIEGPASIEATARLRAPVRLDVQSVAEDGSALININLDRPTIELDTTATRQSIPAARDSLASARVSVRVLPSGTILERTGTIPNDGTVANFSEHLADAISMSWVQFPAEPVQTGHSWLQTIPLSIGAGGSAIDATTSARYTLTGYAMVDGREMAVIDVVYSHQIEGTIQAGEEGVRTVRVVGRGRGQGYIIFDHRMGRLHESAYEAGSVITSTDDGGSRTTHAISSETQYRHTSASGPEQGEQADDE